MLPANLRPGAALSSSFTGRSQSQHTAGSPLSCFLGQEGSLLLSQAGEAPGKAAGAVKTQSNSGEIQDVRKPLTQQNGRQLQTTGTACSTSSSQAALCCTAQGKLNHTQSKTDLLVAQENPHSFFQLLGEGALRSCSAQGQMERWSSGE